jgi:hypothetical protein
MFFRAVFDQNAISIRLEAAAMASIGNVVNMAA